MQEIHKRSQQCDRLLWGLHWLPIKHVFNKNVITCVQSSQYRYPTLFGSFSYTKVVLQSNTDITKNEHSESTSSLQRTSQYEILLNSWPNNVERTTDRRTEIMYQCRCVDMHRVSLELSTAFDTINHNVLLNRLQYLYGITDTAFKWFQSYIEQRNNQVCVGYKDGQ